MRSAMNLMVAGLAFTAFEAVAQEGARAGAGFPLADTPPNWQAESAAGAFARNPPRRLSYLDGATCARSGDCPVSVVDPDPLDRDYIKSLNLGSYGPMDLKFTGNRVKLKVRF